MTQGICYFELCTYLHYFHDSFMQCALIIFKLLLHILLYSSLSICIFVLSCVLKFFKTNLWCPDSLECVTFHWFTCQGLHSQRKLSLPLENWQLPSAPWVGLGLYAHPHHNPLTGIWFCIAFHIFCECCHNCWKFICAVPCCVQKLMFLSSHLLWQDPTLFQANLPQCPWA